MDTEDAAKTDDFDNCIRFFLAGSTALRDYETAMSVLQSLKSSLSVEWANRLKTYGPADAVLPTIEVHSAESTKEQSELNALIKKSDVAVFFLDECRPCGDILKEEMLSALGSFLRTGNPYPYVFLCEGSGQTRYDGLDEILNQFGFMQYTVVYNRTNYIEYLRELAKIALSVYIEKRYYPKKAVLSRIPQEAGFPKSDEIDPSLVNCCMYLCNRLLYTRGLNVEINKSETSKVNTQHAIKLRSGSRSVALYVKKGDDPCIEAMAYNNALKDNKLQFNETISLSLFSPSDEMLARYVSGVCERIAAFLTAGEVPLNPNE